MLCVLYNARHCFKCWEYKVEQDKHSDLKASKDIAKVDSFFFFSPKLVCPLSLTVHLVFSSFQKQILFYKVSDALTSVCLFWLL